MLNAIFLLLAAGAPSVPVAAAPAPAAEVSAPDPKKMSQSEIRAHNAKLARDHPYFIRCVRSADTGSLVKRGSSCRTNQQWADAEEAGNREARDIADRMSSKAMPTN